MVNTTQALTELRNNTENKRLDTSQDLAVIKYGGQQVINLITNYSCSNINMTTQND